MQVWRLAFSGDYAERRKRVFWKKYNFPGLGKECFGKKTAFPDWEKGVLEKVWLSLIK
jgi:hypothetical protein